MDKPAAISVIVRTLGRSERLAEALESLSLRTRRDFEVVVVDMSHGRNGAVLDRLFAPALATLPVPDRQHALRYEWRGRRLQERGEVDQVITYGDHFLPVVEALQRQA